MTPERAAGERKKKKRGQGAGRLKDQRLGDSRGRDHPNNSSRGCWEGREVLGRLGGGGGVMPEGEDLHIIADS